MRVFYMLLFVTTWFLVFGKDVVCPNRVNSKLVGGFDKSSKKCLILHKELSKRSTSDNYYEASKQCKQLYNGILHSFGTLPSGKDAYHNIDNTFYEFVQGSVNQFVLNGLRVVRLTSSRRDKHAFYFIHTNGSTFFINYDVGTENTWSSPEALQLGNDTLWQLFHTKVQKPVCLKVKIGSKGFKDSLFFPCDKIEFNYFFCQTNVLENCQLVGSHCNCKPGFTGQFCEKNEVGHIVINENTVIYTMIAVGGTVAIVVLSALLNIVYHRKKLRDAIKKRRELRKKKEVQRALKRFDAMGINMESRRR